MLVLLFNLLLYTIKMKNYKSIEQFSDDNTYSKDKFNKVRHKEKSFKKKKMKREKFKYGNKNHAENY